MQDDRLKKQVEFILEIDKLKTIFRQSYLIHAERRENSAEHSWHVAVMALLLTEYAEKKVDLLRILQMLLIHDIVEIDAGDTYCYDEVNSVDKAVREQQAALRIFGLLPGEQGKELRVIWEEFAASVSPEAKFANAVDRLMPLLHNYYTQGKSWQAHSITKDQVLARTVQIQEVSSSLWQWINALLEDAVARGYLLK
jgi:putative hydrolase of HD superfamily